MMDDQDNSSQDDNFSSNFSAGKPPETGEKKQEEGSMSSTNDETFSIYILKTNLQSLKGAETYLKNRGWTVGTGTDLRSALAYIIQKQPSVVLLSADHPNKKVKMLPRLLSQAFPVKIIAFAEKQGSQSMRALQDMKQEYNLFPPVSGPAIERLIRKMKKDEEMKQKAYEESLKAGNTDPNSQSSDEVLRFSNDQSGAGKNHSTFEAAQKALSALVGGNDDEDVSGSFEQNEAKSAGGPGMYMSQGAPRQLGPAYMGGVGAFGDKPAGYIPTPQELQAQWNQLPEEDKAQENFDDWAGKMRELAAQGAFAQAKANGGNGYFPQNQSGTPSGGPQSQQQQGSSQGASSSFQNSESDWQGMDPASGPARPNKDQAPGASSANDIGWKHDTPRRWQKKEAPIMESGPIKKKGKRSQILEQYSKEDLSKESLIVKGTQQSLDETVLVRDDLDEDDVKEVEKTSNVACITVESARFSGYLVCAMGKNRKIDKAFIDMIQKRLFSFLKNNGEQINEKDTMSLKLQEVDFQDWALAQAEFLRKSVHERDEVAMAFFPNKNLNEHLEDSASEKMVKMTIDELKEDTPIEFDLYIFMPENNKYLLYTPQGMTFYGNQKGRLKDKGVTHMHLRRDSITGVKKYRAQNFLNEKIAGYQALKKSMAS